MPRWFARSSHNTLLYRRLAQYTCLLSPDCPTCVILSSNTTIEFYPPVAIVVDLSVITYIDSIDLTVSMEYMDCVRKKKGGRLSDVKMAPDSSGSFNPWESVFVQHGREFATSSIVPMHPGYPRTSPIVVIE